MNERSYPHPEHGIIDIRDIHERGKRKWYSPKKRVSKKDGICFHHTAVEGGFGTHSSRRALYEGKPRDWSRWVVRPKAELSDDQYVKAMALAHRFRGDKPTKSNTGVPYHVVHSNDGTLYLNLEFDWVTWHGNRSNQDYLGFGWDALSSAETPDVPALKDSIRYVVELAREEGHPMTKFTGHCAWTNKPRDPGPEFIREVMEPMAKELGCVIDYDFVDTRAKAKARSIGSVLGRSSD